MVKKGQKSVYVVIECPLMDLSKEVLNIDFGQVTAKISELKVGGQKKYLTTRPV